MVTKSPTETENALRAKLPPKYWIPFNQLLVPFGPNQCNPSLSLVVFVSPGLWLSKKQGFQVKVEIDCLESPLELVLHSIPPWRESNERLGMPSFAEALF